MVAGLKVDQVVDKLVLRLQAMHQSATVEVAQ
jgi:hypothetical protein